MEVRDKVLYSFKTANIKLPHDKEILNRRKPVYVEWGTCGNDPMLLTTQGGETVGYKIHHVKGKRDCYMKAAARLGYTSKIDKPVDAAVHLPAIFMTLGDDNARFNIMMNNMVLIVRESDEPDSKAHAFVLERRTKSGVF
jgi:hypothetical protein